MAYLYLMAFQLGDSKFSGTVDDISFYNSVFGWLVRRKGGPTRKQFKTAPAFERARENSTEFTTCSRSAALIRHLVLKSTGLKDKSLYHRVMRLMRLLADEDKSSPRGSRDPLKGMRTSAGQRLLQDFELSRGRNLYDILLTTDLLKVTEKAAPSSNELGSDLRRVKKNLRVFRSTPQKPNSRRGQRRGIPRKAPATEQVIFHPGNIAGIPIAQKNPGPKTNDQHPNLSADRSG